MYNPNQIVGKINARSFQVLQTTEKTVRSTSLPGLLQQHESPDNYQIIFGGKVTARNVFKTSICIGGMVTARN